MGKKEYACPMDRYREHSAEERYKTHFILQDMKRGKVEIKTRLKDLQYFSIELRLNIPAAGTNGRTAESCSLLMAYNSVSQSLDFKFLGDKCERTQKF